MDSAVWGLIGTVVGAMASICTTALTQYNATRLQRRANELERAERSRGFQRETILQLQDALLDSGRLATRAHMHDVSAFRLGQNWAEIRLPDDLDEAIRLGNKKLSILIERLNDDECRQRVVMFRLAMSRCTGAQSEAESNEGFVEMSSQWEQLSPNLGQLLRAYY